MKRASQRNQALRNVATCAMNAVISDGRVDCMEGTLIGNSDDKDNPYPYLKWDFMMPDGQSLFAYASLKYVNVLEVNVYFEFQKQRYPTGKTPRLAYFSFLRSSTGGFRACIGIKPHGERGVFEASRSLTRHLASFKVEAYENVYSTWIEYT